MLARIQQCVTLGIVLLTAAWIACWLSAGSPFIAGTGILFSVGAYAGVILVEFALLWWVSRHDASGRATALQLVRAWWGEILSAPPVFCWRQPFRSHAIPDLMRATHSPYRAVVFVHGFACNRGLWNPWLERLHTLRVPFAAVDLEPVFGHIDDYGSILDKAVRQAEAATGFPPVLVAHSMGGLAVRAWLQRYAADARVHHVITVASPHHGTFMSRFAMSPNTRQMALHAPWLAQLSSQETPARRRKFTCFYGCCDNIVFPVSTATLPDADNRHVPDCAHVRMATHEDVFNELLRWIELPNTDPPERNNIEGASAAHAPNPLLASRSID